MPGVIAALAAALVSFAVLYLVLDRRIRKKVDPQTILGQIRREIEGLILELNQTAERNLTLMEEKMGVLRDVLEDAEKRVAVLRREAQTLQRVERAYTALRPAPEAAPEPSGKGGVERRRGARARGRLPAARPRPNAAARAAEAAAEAPDPAETRARVLSLHRAGISVDSIVRSLRVPRATVDLIVSLEEGSGPAPGRSAASETAP